MDNNTATRPRSRLKGDAYRAFEALPAEVRRALQESLVDWCPLRAREWYLDLRNRDGLREAQAATYLVETIRRLDQAEVVAFARSWPKGVAAYPHLAAGATLQAYAGPEGIPAARPVALPPPPRPAKPKPAAKPPAKRAKRPGKRAAGRRRR
ncbi:MAG: hypothetical protein K2X11_07490 [Acetobacteraceae bacterium]|nr:hypothetical protein [Acetobacteraceae bacterium]